MPTSGNILLDQGDFSSAKQRFEQVIGLRPDDPEAHRGLGDAFLGMNCVADALIEFDRALARRPDYHEAHTDRGNALRMLKRPDEALASFDRAIALRPDEAGPYFSRGELLRAEGRIDDAVASLEAAIAADPLHGASRIAACMVHLPIIYASAAEISERRSAYIAAWQRLAVAAEDPAVARAVSAEIGSPAFYLPYQGENDVVPQGKYGQLACPCPGGDRAAHDTRAPPLPR